MALASKQASVFEQRSRPCLVQAAREAPQGVES